MRVSVGAAVSPIAPGMLATDPLMVGAVVVEPDVTTVVPGVNATPRNASLEGAVFSAVIVDDMVAPAAALSTILVRVPEVPAEPLDVAYSVGLPPTRVPVRPLTCESVAVPFALHFDDA